VYKAQAWRLVAAVLLVGTFVAAAVWNHAREPSSPLVYVPEANRRAQSWLFYNMRTKGLFVYEFNPITGNRPNANNAIRQLMASRVLASESIEHTELQELHEHNLDFLFRYWYEEDEPIGYIFYNNKSKLGANAMMLRTLAASPVFEEYREEAAALAESIYALQNENGSFEPWYKEPSYSYNADRLLTFYSGEALVALVEYYNRTGNTRALEAAQHSADYYIDAYVTRMDEHYYPAYVPWHSIAYNELYKITDEQQYADAIFAMTDKLLEIQDTERYIGRFYNPDTPQYGSPHSSSDAVYTEGLAYAYEIAEMAGDTKRAQRYRDALEIGVRNLISLQYTAPREVSVVEDPRRYVGAMRINVDNPRIRVDTTQHAIDAFTKIEELGLPEKVR